MSSEIAAIAQAAQIISVVDEVDFTRIIACSYIRLLSPARSSFSKNRV